MPLPVIANTYRVSVEGLLANGSTWANVIHTRFNAGGATTADVNAMEALVDRLYTGATLGDATGFWTNWASTLASIQRIRVTALDGVSASVVYALVQAGAAAGDPLPGGVSWVVTLRTAKRGRSYRGRAYMGGFAEANNTAAGLVQSTLVTSMLSGWEGLRTTLSAAGWSLVVASYKHSTAETVTSVSADAVWDSQRRRNTP